MSKENAFSSKTLFEKYPELLDALLIDHSSGKNIIWATNEKVFYNVIKPSDYFEGRVIPRVLKRIENQKDRSKDMAEVFTPSWVCDKQNTLVEDNLQEMNTKPIDYLTKICLEMACGECPYLTNRYDVVSGEEVPIPERIGLLDRKLSLVSDISKNSSEWIELASVALKSTYGFDYQGDNVLIGRINILLSLNDYFYEKYQTNLTYDDLFRFANIINWNIWQMDGIKLVIPGSCHDEEFLGFDFFGDAEPTPCPGCANEDVFRHNGIRTKIMDWTENRELEFIELVNKRF